MFGGGTIAFGSSSETPPLPELASGTTLYWLEGPRAGVTTVATTPDIELTSSQSDRRCFGWTTTLMFDKPKAQWPRWSFCVDRDAAR